MRSHFSSQTLAEVFRDLFVEERTGILRLTGEEGDKLVWLRQGLVFYAASDADAESLGASLVREGGISSGALIEAQQAASGSADELTLAACLVRRDLVAKETLLHAVRVQSRRVVRAAFGWKGGSALFEEREVDPGVLEADVLSTVELLLTGIENMAVFEPIHDAMLALENRLEQQQPAPFPLERLTLTPSQGFILSRLDGNTALRDLISILPPGEEVAASRFLFGLLVFGVVVYHPALSHGPFTASDILRDHADRQALEQMQAQIVQQAYGQVRSQSPHDILGLTQSAGLRDIERAYERSKAQFGRERLLPSIRERYRDELTMIESRLVEAYLMLTQPERHEGARAAAVPEDVAIDDLRVRVEMDKAKSKVALEHASRVADAYFAKARSALREGDYHNAIQYTKLAVSHNPSDARYYFLLANCQMRNPEARWQRMAEENLLKTTQLDPWNADYWIGLGRFYKSQGLNIRARKQFEEALKLVPNNTTVLEELGSLG